MVEYRRNSKLIKKRITMKGGYSNVKFVQFIGGDSVRLGIKTEKGIIDVEQCATLLSMDVPTTMEQVIVGGEEALLQLKQLTTKEVPMFQKKKWYMHHASPNQKKLFALV